MLYNVYCDESCHLENDDSNVMVLGAIWCPQRKLQEINDRIREIKKQDGISPTTELKWVKVSPAGVQVYKDLIDYFFDDDNLHFRALIIPDKSRLNHAYFNQTHDEWYYKMYFDMLKIIFSQMDKYEVYIDIKDTHSYRKAQKLREVCCNNMHDFSESILTRLQPIRSEEVQLMQLVDLLIGAIAYENRCFPDGFVKSGGKQALIDQIKCRFWHSLHHSTSYQEDKMNLFFWDARDTV